MAIKHYTDIAGWCDFDNFYVDVVNRSKQGETYFCEVGTWLGRSTGLLAGLLKLIRPGSHLMAIDNWTGDLTTEYQAEVVKKHNGSIFEAFWQNMIDLGVDHIISPIKSVSWEAPAIIPPEICFEMVFLDACHKYESITKDIAAYWPRVAKGGIFSGHDYTSHVQTAIHEFAQKNNLKVYRNNMVWIIPKE